MARNDMLELLTGELLDEDLELSLAELCRVCQLPAEQILELVEEGVIEPRGGEPGRWRFRAVSIRRVRRVRRLQEDLRVNLPGAALVVELLEELEALRERLRQLER